MAFKDLVPSDKLRVRPRLGRVDRLKKTGWKADAGAIGSAGYRMISVGGRMVLVHRIIYESVHGPLAAGMDVDHINGDKTDNRICNLRAVTRSQNMQNVARPQANNVLGVRGVSWSKQKNKYRVTINLNKKQKHIGFFALLDAAGKAYLQAAKEFHTHTPVGAHHGV